MPFFVVRRTRVRPEFAHLYPEIVPGIWISARRATRLVRRHPRPREQRPVPDDGRVLPELHFEFQGGRPKPPEAETWVVRASPRLQ